MTAPTATDRVESPAIRYVGTVRTGTGAEAPVCVSLERHECNHFCRSGAHVELVYRAEAEPLSMSCAQAIADLVSRGRRVLDVRLAPEAPLPCGYRAAWLVTYGPLPIAARDAAGRARR